MCHAAIPAPRAQVRGAHLITSNSGHAGYPQRPDRRERSVLAPPTEVVDVDDLIEVPDVHTRVMIEEAAIDVVWTWLKRAKWEVDDVQKENLGWDLTATRGSETALVEVKGRFGSAVDVLLSPHEFQAASDHDNWELAVVTCALDEEPGLDWFTALDIRSASTVALHRFRFDREA